VKNWLCRKGRSKCQEDLVVVSEPGSEAAVLV